MLGTRRQAGRAVVDSADRPADGAVAVLGSALSRRLFGDENPVGAFMSVGGHPVQIVGIAEEGFRGTDTSFDSDADIFVAWGMADRFAAEPANDFQRPDAARDEYGANLIRAFAATRAIRRTAAVSADGSWPERSVNAAHNYFARPL